MGHLLCCVCGHQRVTSGNASFPFPMWVPMIKLRLSGLATNMPTVLRVDLKAMLTDVLLLGS